jgi:catechol 2,3-dioxygenase-like lactoylglutathione lyase family enzyme
MAIHGFTHVALRTDRLRDAEGFYRRLFGLEVAFREVECEDGWRTASPGAEWNSLDAAGIEPGLVMLYRDGFRLALELADAVSAAGQLSHLGVFVSEDELSRIAQAAAESGCHTEVHRADALIFDDPYGTRWELNTFAYADPPSMSTGARTGRWVQGRGRRLELPHADGGAVRADLASSMRSPAGSAPPGSR